MYVQIEEYLFGEVGSYCQICFRMDFPILVVLVLNVLYWMKVAEH